MIHVLAGIVEQAPSGGDAVVGILSGLGSGGATAVCLWTIYNQREKRHAIESDAKDARIKELTDKLIDLAETGSKVTHLGAEVARDEQSDLRRQLRRIQDLLEDR